MRKILIIILVASSVYCLADNNDAIYDPIRTPIYFGKTLFCSTIVDNIDETPCDPESRLVVCSPNVIDTIQGVMLFWIHFDTTNVAVNKELKVKEIVDLEFIRYDKTEFCMDALRPAFYEELRLWHWWLGDYINPLTVYPWQQWIMKFIVIPKTLPQELHYANEIFASVPKQSYRGRDFAFDVSVAINEYKRYYWLYPDSMESFLSFAKDYATHFWNDLSRKEKSNSTWYQAYKKLERNKQDYSIVASGGTCTLTDQKRQEEIVFTNTACEDCKLESLNISDFRRLYVLSAFDGLNHILWNQSDSLYLLYAQLQKQISLAENAAGTLNITSREMLLFQYRHIDASLSFRCKSDTAEYSLSAALEELICKQLKEYCVRHEDISTINMYLIAAPLQCKSSSKVQMMCTQKNNSALSLIALYH